MERTSAKSIVEEELYKLIKSCDNIEIVIEPGLFIAALNYGVGERNILNFAKIGKNYHSHLRFMGANFLTYTEKRIMDSDEFFKERPAR